MKPLLLTLLIGLSAVFASAENGSLSIDASPFAQMGSVKKQIIATALDLTPDQCEVFWPLYDAYQQELRLIWTKALSAAIFVFGGAGIPFGRIGKGRDERVPGS